MKVLKSRLHSLSQQRRIVFLGVILAAAILSGLGLGLFGYVQLHAKIVKPANDAEKILEHVIALGNTLMLYQEGILSVSRAKRQADHEAAVSNLPSLRLAILAPLNALAAVNLSEGTDREAKNQLQDLGKAITTYLKFSDGALSALDESYTGSVPIRTRRLLQHVGMLATANEVSRSYADATGRLWEASGRWQVAAKQANEDRQRILLGGTLLISLILVLGTWHLLIHQLIRLILGTNRSEKHLGSPQADPGEESVTDQQRDLIERQVLQFLAAVRTGERDRKSSYATERAQQSLPES
jgi:hypothetical protein